MPRVNVLPTPAPSGRKKGTAHPTMGGKGVVGGKKMKRFRKLKVDCIHGITKPDIRRLARRGGVMRISAMVYEEVRHAMKLHMTSILKDLCHIVDHMQRKTVTVTDVIFVLKRMGRPIYGFDKETYTPEKTPKKVRRV